MKLEKNSFLWVCLWLGIVVAFTIFQSGFYNPDSFKYVSIAKTMLIHHQYLVPMYQGQAYSDKGPLMFWLFVLGWKFTGINYWWPQLVIALSATASLFLSLKLLPLLWKEDEFLLKIFPWILIGLPSWLVLSNEIRTDAFLLFFILSSWITLLKAIEGQHKFWFLYTLAIGLGLLCKGPVILVFTALPALFFPIIFQKYQKSFLKKWYAYLFLATCLSLFFILLWVIPASIMGGNHFSHQIMYQQIYHRAFESFSFFYYIIRLPLFFLPWLLFIPFLIGGLRYSTIGSGEKFCWLIILISFLIFSFYGQKRVHYIDPDFVLFAMIIAKAISNYAKERSIPNIKHQWFMSVLFLIFAITLLIFSNFPDVNNPALRKQFSLFFRHDLLCSIILFILAIFYFKFNPKNYFQQILLITTPTALLCTALLILRVY